MKDTYCISLDRDQIENLIMNTGYYFEDIDDIEDEDVENMICDLLDNI